MAQEYHSLSLGSGIERKKEEREGNWRKRNLGWLKRINRVLFLLFANLWTIEQNPGSLVIQAGRALCPAVGARSWGRTTRVPNLQPPGKCGHEGQLVICQRIGPKS